MAVEELDKMVEKNKDDETLDQLMALREITRTTGVLHDAQVLQLKWWPFVVLPNCKTFDIEFSHELKILQYVIRTDKKMPDHLKDRLSYLAKWVKELLGPEYTCRVKINSKLVYKD